MNLIYTQRLQSLPIFKHNDDIGYYVFDEYLQKHCFLSSDTNSRKEKDITTSLNKLEVSTNNGQTWKPALNIIEYKCICGHINYGFMFSEVEDEEPGTDTKLGVCPKCNQFEPLVPTKGNR